MHFTHHSMVPIQRVSMAGLLRALLLILCVTGPSAYAQFYGENIDLVDADSLCSHFGDGRDCGAGAFKADSLYLGAPFLRDTTKPFLVWFYRTVDPCNVIPGVLYIVYQNGSMDPLFPNVDATCVPHSSADVHDLTEITRGKINHNDTVYFAYRTNPGMGGPHGPLPQIRYTGPNRSPNDVPAWSTTDRFWTNSDIFLDERAYWHSTGPVTGPVIGRRFNVAGWIRENGKRTDAIEFAFEDGADKNYSDNIFHVTGLFLIKNPVFDNLILTAVPDQNLLTAGDSIHYIVTLLGMDTLGNQITWPADTIRKYVTWQLVRVSDTTGDGELLNGTSNTAENTFTATRAYDEYQIRITFNKPGSPILTTSKTVSVGPGPAAYVSIEALSDDSVMAAANLTAAAPVEVIQLPLSIHGKRGQDGAVRQPGRRGTVRS